MHLKANKQLVSIVVEIRLNSIQMETDKCKLKPRSTPGRSSLVPTDSNVDVKPTLESHHNPATASEIKDVDSGDMHGNTPFWLHT